MSTTQARRWFGTDGIRARVGEPPLTPEFVLRLAWTAAHVLNHGEGGGLVVVGKDTRRSGYMYEAALEAGFSAAGMDIRLLGPVPTPAVAYLTRTLRANLGVVISASHNPYQDNGIKFFDPGGRKLDDATEHAIERALESEHLVADPERIGRAKRVEDARGRYIEFCKASVSHGVSLAGLKLVLDCAHGATYAVAEHVFSDLGAEVVLVAAEPDGFNINVDCGSTHPEYVVQAVKDHDADYGLAFDGDGDRVVVVDATGRIFDGDDLLYIIATERAARGVLSGPVVGTVMSNTGLERALEVQGIAFERTPVGDRQVLARLNASGGVIGGENSGHIVCLDFSTTGDGIIAGLAVLAAAVTYERSLAELCAPLVKLPQVIRNVTLDGVEKEVVLNDSRLSEAVSGVQQRLAGNGRVLLRASGTEALIRVMVEGPEVELTTACAEEIANVVRQISQR
jgi:phosphoglucosamine mutase